LNGFDKIFLMRSSWIHSNTAHSTDAQHLLFVAQQWNGIDMKLVIKQSQVQVPTIPLLCTSKSPNTYLMSSVKVPYTSKCYIQNCITGYAISQLQIVHVKFHL